MILYCQKLKAQHGLVPATSEEVAKKIEQEGINQFNKQDIDQKLKDGKLQMAVKKESDNMVVKKKGKKPKAKTAQETSKAFNVDFAVINKFGLVQVSPPISSEDLESKITELQDKQKRFTRDGNEELEKERSDIEQNVEKMVEEDIQAEILAAQDEEEDSQEEAKEEKKVVKPVRGGLKKPKDEFFDGSSDEDEIIQSAYAKPTRGGGQQVRGARGGRGGRGGKRVRLDEEEFPTL